MRRRPAGGKGFGGDSDDPYHRASSDLGCQPSTDQFSDQPLLRSSFDPIRFPVYAHECVRCRVSGATATLRTEGFEDVITVTIHSAQSIRRDRHVEMLSGLDRPLDRRGCPCAAIARFEQACWEVPAETSLPFPVLG